MTLIPTSITLCTPAFGTGCSSYRTCCVAGLEMLCAKRMITALPTMYGGGLPRYGAASASCSEVVAADKKRFNQ